MLRISQVKVSGMYEEKELKQKIAKLLHCSLEQIKELHIVKESLDARKKPALFYSLVVDVLVVGEEKILAKNKDSNIKKAPKDPFVFYVSGTKKLVHPPVIIGTGPAGLLCGYFLAKHGYRPILLERGKAVEERLSDVKEFWESGILNTSSNVQFGEGGAGTFSDGKLNTLVKDKDGRCKKVLQIFAQHGAPEDIVYKQKPHVGTDLLVSMVQNLRNEIIRMGGQVRFSSCATEFLKDEAGALRAVVLQSGEVIKTDVAVLAIGHSARDTFQVLKELGTDMQAKAFAVGYRVMHPQTLINESQYGKQEPAVLDRLGQAAYKLTYQASNGRGVYTFCMCPGGYVVNASSEEGRLAINGMSYRDRASKVSNSAVIMTVTPQDFEGEDPLAGVSFQRGLEEKAYQLAKGKLPVQSLKAFRNQQVDTEEDQEKVDKNLMEDGNSYAVKGALAFANTRSILPETLNEAFLEGMQDFGRKIKGYDSDEVLLCGVESRTSSPVKILRDENGQSNILGLFPCGEGAGYAGGITSAAMDGIYIAQQIAKQYSPMSL